jgi:hypothetical protein
MKMYNKVN